MILHAAIHWPEVADLQLWSFALQHAVSLWNVLLHSETKLSPLEYVLNLEKYKLHLHWLHVWDCHNGLLDPVSVVLCDISSTLINLSLLLNSQTGAITPHNHLVYDDLFSTLSNEIQYSLSPELWIQFILSGYELVTMMKMIKRLIHGLILDQLL